MPERCGKHDCEMVVKKMGVGWGGESKFICPECEAEAGQQKVVFSSNGGWGSKN